MILPTMPDKLTSREYLRIGGGFGASAAGTSPPGGLDVDPSGHLATNGGITAAGGLSVGGALLVVDPSEDTVVAQDLEVEGDFRITGRDLAWSAWLHAADGFPTSNAGCSAATQTQVRLREVEYRSLDFAPSVDQRAIFNFVLPPHYTGGPLEVELFWTFNSGTPGDDVRWVINALCLDHGDDMDQSITPSVAYAPSTADTAHHLHRASALTTPVNGAAGAFCNLLLIRGAAHASDTFDGPARLMAVRVRLG